MKGKLDILTYRGKLWRFICKQRYILFCFFLGILFCTIAILIFIQVRFSSDVYIIPSVISLLFFYIALISCNNYYRIYIFIQKLRDKDVDYNACQFKAIIFQDNITTKSFIHSNNINLSIRSQEKIVSTIISKEFAVIFGWYKELGLYSRLSQPIWLDLNANNMWQNIKPKGFKRISQKVIEKDCKDLVITITRDKNDFRKIILKNFFD